MKAGDYERWYQTPRGRWIADTEFALMADLLAPEAGATLLDAGGGTGQFSRRFAAAGLRVTGLDADPERSRYAREHTVIAQVAGSMLTLPFGDGTFDYVAAVTSLCFVEPPEPAVRELWRVCRRALVLGLLNRNSLLYYRKHDSGGYRGARWDRARAVCAWAGRLEPAPRVSMGSAVMLPGGGVVARRIERLLPSSLAWGGFLAVALHKS